MTYKKQRNVKERNIDFLFPKCQTHTYTWFENGCSENSAQKLRTKYSTEEKINTLLKTSGTVFPNTDWLANNIYVTNARFTLRHVC